MAGSPKWKGWPRSGVGATPFVDPSVDDVQDRLQLRRASRRFGPLGIMFGERKVPLARGLGQRLPGSKLLARRLTVQEMHIRVQATPPQLSPAPFR
jgi:hypothetical protein